MNIPVTLVKLTSDTDGLSATLAGDLVCSEAAELNMYVYFPLHAHRGREAEDLDSEAIRAQKIFIKNKPYRKQKC